MATYLIIVFQILPLDGGTLSKLHSPTLHVTSWWPHFALCNTCTAILSNTCTALVDDDNGDDSFTLHVTPRWPPCAMHCAIHQYLITNHCTASCEEWWSTPPTPPPPDPLHTHCVLAKRFELWPCLAILASSCVGSLRRSGKISFLSNWQKWDRDNCEDVDQEDSEW